MEVYAMPAQKFGNESETTPKVKESNLKGTSTSEVYYIATTVWQA